MVTLILITSLFSAIYCVPAASAVNNKVLINEIELSPAGTDSGAEKVELYDPSSSAIDVSGWTVNSTAGRTATVIINEGTTTIPLKDYQIVGRDSQQWLDNIGEVIELRNDLGMLIDSAGPFSDKANYVTTWQQSPDREQENWVFSSNTLSGANFTTLVSDSESPLPLAPEHPIIQPEPSLLGNSSVEVTPDIQPSQNLTISFIDVGHGDSILVILPNTKTLLIDGGTPEASGKVLATLREHGLSHIDVVVATHAHLDHLGGLFDVVENVDVGQVLGSQVHTTEYFEDFLYAINTKQIPLKLVREGDSINLDPTVKIDVLNPPTTVSEISHNSGCNNCSVILKLTYGEFSALLTGDMEKEAEAILVSENSPALDVDVLKAGHHGDSNASTSSFLNAVTPEVVIISSGAGSSYGFPHYEALERISAAGIQHLFRTDLDGTITLTANRCSEYYSIVNENNEKTVVVDDVPEFEMATR
jgi:competence protein ComEC